MKGVILGNGPSKHLYDRSGDIIIGCNFPGEEYSVDATVICDEEIVYILKTTPNLITCPIIISEKVFEKLKELKLVDKYIILCVFKVRDWHNAAHYAAQYLITTGCEEIDVWGCDSMFSETISSSTDAFVPKSDSDGARFIKKWRAVWNALFVYYPDITFQVMKIKETK
jgi:hypothetical protein